MLHSPARRQTPSFAPSLPSLFDEITGAQSQQILVVVSQSTLLLRFEMESSSELGRLLENGICPEVYYELVCFDGNTEKRDP